MKNMNDNPLISIIVPVYKVEAFLDRCIRSVLLQDYANFELILVDDGSPDRCGEICDCYAESDKRIKAIHKENGGLSDARNAGINVAKGEYLSFVDSDDYVEPTLLSYLLSLRNEAIGCKVIQANHYIERGNKIAVNAPVQGRTTVFSRRDALEAVLYHDRVDVSAWGSLYSSSVFDNLRFPKGRLYEDTYIFCDIMDQIDTLIYGDYPQYHYIQRAGSIVNNSFQLKNLEYIDAVIRLADYAMKEDPSLEPACHRRITHSYLSVLRYMEHVEPEYKELRDELRQKALRYAEEVCSDQRAPQRDKYALRLLKLGFFPFYKGWSMYSNLRR